MVKRCVSRQRIIRALVVSIVVLWAAPSGAVLFGDWIVSRHQAASEATATARPAEDIRSDAHGRRLERTLPDGRMELYAYGPEDETACVTETPQQEWIERRVYTRGWLTTVLSADGNETVIHYAPEIPATAKGDWQEIWIRIREGKRDTLYRYNRAGQWQGTWAGGRYYTDSRMSPPSSWGTNLSMKRLRLEDVAVTGVSEASP